LAELEATAAGKRRWWEDPFSVFQTNLREVDAGLDEKAVVATVHDLGATAWLLNVGGIVSFYPSQLDFQNPSPWLSARKSGDLVADAVEAAHRAGVRVIGRLDFSKLHQEIAERHPDWWFVGADGLPQVYNGLYSMCPSAAYYQEKSFEILGEVLDHYSVDGLFFNWFNFNERDYSGRPRGICQCWSCRSRFRRATGHDLPLSPDSAYEVYLQWRTFTREVLRDLAERIREFIHRRREDVALVLPYNPDVIMHEVNNALDRPQPLWVTWAGEQTRRARGESPGKPVMINSVTFLDLPYRFTAEQPGLVQLELAQVISQGCNPSAYIIGTPDLADRRALSASRELLRFHRENARYYKDLHSCARVLLVWPARSAEIRDQTMPNGGSLDEARGVYRALLEGHVPFDMVTDEELGRAAADGELARYGALVLPGVSILSAEEVRLVDAFVQAGGGLVATADTGLFDVGGTEVAEVRLASLGAGRLRFRREGRDLYRSSYLAVTDPADLPGANTDARLPLDAFFLHMEPRAGARESLAFVPPSRYGPPEKCYGAGPTEQAGLFHYRFGNGQSAFCPWPSGSLYYRTGLADFRELLVAAVLHVSPEGRQVETDAPPQVEVVVSNQDVHHRLLVHLINYSGYQGRAFYEPIVLRSVSISVRAGGVFGRARAVRAGCDLEVRARDGLVSTELDRLGLFELLVFE
jgi:hypothetical protein